MTHIVAVRNGMSASDEKDLSNIAVAFISSGGGVVGTGDYQVAAQSTPNNTVQIATGRAYVPLSDDSMVYATHLDASQNVTISANSSGSGQVDTIVLYIDLSASPDAAADNVAKFSDVRGTSGSAPTNGQILTAIGSSNPYIKLANIAVANGFTSISNGNITDVRTAVAMTTGNTVPVALYEEFADQGSAVAAPASGKTRVFTESGGLYSIVNGGTAAQVGSTTVVADGNSGSALTIDWSKGNTHTVTMTASCTFTFSNPTVGMHLTLFLTQGGSGSYTATWPGTVKWSGGTAPTLSTTVGKVDLIGLIWNGTSYFGFSSLNY